jgi:hypothetical protein
MPIAVVFLYGMSAKGLHYPVVRALFALAFAWSLAGVFFLRRGMWSAAMPGDAALSTGLEFYRREIERRSKLFRRLLWCSFLPMVLAIGTIILAMEQVAGGKFFPKAMPFITLVIVWVGVYFAIRMREQRELKREIDELSEIEKANR